MRLEKAQYFFLHHKPPPAHGIIFMYVIKKSKIKLEHQLRTLRKYLMRSNHSLLLLSHSPAQLFNNFIKETIQFTANVAHCVSNVVHFFFIPLPHFSLLVPQ